MSGFTFAPDWLKQGVTRKAKAMQFRISTFDIQLKICSILLRLRVAFGKRFILSGFLYAPYESEEDAPRLA